MTGYSMTTKPTIRPVGNYILIERRQKSDTTLVLPDEASSDSFDVIVVAVGPDAKHLASDDNVLLRPNSNILPLAGLGQPTLALVDAGAVVAILS